MSAAPREAVVGVAAGLAVIAVVLAVAQVRDLDRAARARRRLQAPSGVAPSDRPAPGGRAGFDVWARFEERCARRRLPSVVRRPLEGLGLAWAPEVVVAFAVVVLLATTAGTAVVVGPGAAPVVALAGSLGAVVVLGLSAGRADRLVDRELPAVLDRISALLRAGASLPRAVADAADVAAGPLQADLDQVAARLAAGEDVTQAIDRWRSERRTPSVRTTAAAIAIAHRVGGGAARAIDGVATSLRDRAAVQREVMALSTQARASAVVIVLAPLGFGLFTGAADRQTWQFLTATPAGWACLAGGVVLDAAGGLWMAWLARSVGRA